MPPTDDMTLLREYATKGSETAFETLVHRHVNLVYSAAFRQVQNPALCEEVTQTVFIILARKAHRLSRNAVLSGWLYRTAQFAASKALRAELRRRHHESEASQMQPEPSDTTWDQIAPLLEQAMAGLSNGDRNAVVLRYFENKSLREVGLGMGTNERAAQKRVSRALEKLRVFFTRRGTVLSAGVLAAALSTNAVQAAPAGLATSAAAAGLAKGVGLAGSTGALVKATLKFMTWMKLKTAVLATVGLLVFTGATTVVVSKISPSEPLYEGKPLSYWLARYDPDPSDDPASNKAIQAVRYLGTNAIPPLLRMLQTPKRHFIEYRVVHAFQILGPLAKPAVPALAELLDRDNKADEAADILGYSVPNWVVLDPEAALPLVRALTNRAEPVRELAANRLGLFKSQPYTEIVAPALIAALKDPAPSVRRSAALSLCFKQEAARIVPALMEALADSEPEVRGCALWRLGHFHSPQATNALPKVLALLNDPDLKVRMDATNTFRAISPEAAAKTGIGGWNPGGHFPGGYPGPEWPPPWEKR